MTEVCMLSDKSCAPCQGIGEAMELSVAQGMMAQLADGWVLADDGKSLTREYRFKGFAKAVYMANTAAFLADQQGHHPDVSFGWGYCRVLFTSHELGGLSENDFICAAKLDQMVAVTARA
ncbi:4a-hydroxytetrahydrobiopterin dehydratase [Falsihalocynthiibacter sp. S25ZX9]|uniref:4a-hydroxytetrahydrobiopterin dehydratase n=1 Tax=Falsihalocynthiibacter sp. S25ZX9 TaxID=3240870 RepID=UPI00350F5163